LKILRGQIKKREEYQKLKKVGFMLILMLVAVSLLVAGSSCEGGGGNATPTATVNPTATQPTATSAQPTKTTGPTTTATTDVSKQPRNEKWLFGTWQATVPGTASIGLAGKKVQLVVTEVALEQDESMQGNPVRLFAYAGSIIWDVGGDQGTQAFNHDPVSWPTSGENVLTWSSTGLMGQFMENVSLRIYTDPSVYDFELDWGPATSKAGSTWNSLDFYGTIWDRTADGSAVFAPDELGYLKFTKIN
jgi:hypothetical protein